MWGVIEWLCPSDSPVVLKIAHVICILLTAIPNQGPDEPELSLAWALLWDGDGIEFYIHIYIYISTSISSRGPYFGMRVVWTRVP